MDEPWFAKWWFKLAKGISRWFCRSFFRLRVDGIDNVPPEGGFLFVSNHQSFLDPVLCGIFLKRDLYFLARDTLFKKGFFGWLLRSIHTIPVRRGQADIAAMKAVIEKLRKGNGVCLFPEGTRSKDARISDFKPGLALLCRRADVGIVPVVVDGAFECWPRDKKLFSPGKSITITYGKPISAEKIKQIGNRGLASHLTELLRQMQEQVRKRQGKEPLIY